MKKFLLCLFLLFVLFCCCCTQGSNPNSSLQKPTESDSTSPAVSAQDSQSSVPSSTNSSELPDITQVNLQVTAQNGVLLWNDVSAPVYGIYIEGSLIGTSSVNRYAPELPMGEYVAEIRAYFSMNPPLYVNAFVSLIIPSAPPVIKLENNVISWAKTEGAAHYEIFKNGVYHAKTDSLSLALTERGSYCVRAIFENEKFNSAFSNEVAFDITELTAPVIYLEGSTLKWEAIPGADYYTVCVFGKSAVTITGETELSVDLSVLYNIKFASEYPDGIAVTVIANSDTLPQSQPSNEIFYSN